MPKALLWWEKDTEYWTDVNSVLSLEEALQDPNYEICVVDWFATWCHGCRKTSPFLAELAKNPQLNKRVKFIRACVDSMADYARKQGVKALPYLSIYDNRGNKLLAFGAAASKSATFRPNILTVLDNPGKDYRIGQDGYAVVMDKTQAQKSKEEMDKALAELRSFQAEIGQKLGADQTVAGLNGSNPVELYPTPVVESTHEIEEDTLIKEKQQFLDKYGPDYGYKGWLHANYETELGRRLDGHHYLDYTGSSLYTDSHLRSIMDDFSQHVFGNPHSENPSSVLARDRIEEVRLMILNFFNADPRHYQVIFTTSATAALKTIGETYPWTNRSTFRYLRENHNSVLGIREYVLNHGGQFEDFNEEQVEEWLSKESEASSSGQEPNYHLFAFPAEDNFAGVKYPLEWIERVQAKSTDTDIWKVMLDAAAFVPTQRFSLTDYPADYVSISFYKLFGYPTGLGALIVKVDAIDFLKKVFWAGGSVALATSHDNFHVLKCRPTERFEDGTVAFLDIISLKHGFQQIEKMGGIRSIQAHVQCLTEWMYDALSSLKHSNGEPLVKIFGKHGMPNSRELQGGILNFEILGSDGKILSYKSFEREAARSGFHIRTGIECNPGAAYNYIGVKEAEVESLAGLSEGCDDEVEYIQVERPNDISMFSSVDITELNQLPEETVQNAKLVNVPLGSVRVSLGYMSTFEDCLAFVQFLEAKCKDQES